jgi:hypothetical protein
MDSGDRGGVGTPYPSGPSRVREQIHWAINSWMNDRLSIKRVHQSIMADIAEEHDNVVSNYLAMMDHQRESLFEILEGLSQEALWLRPAEGEWSIGEDLNHLRLINSSTLTLFKITWALLFPLAKIRWDKPCQTDIDKIYKRRWFPLTTGWIWPPKYMPNKPTTLSVLQENLAATHQEVRNFPFHENDSQPVQIFGIWLVRWL